MAVIDGNPPLSNWQFRPTKLNAYEALQTLNRCFEATLLSLERLGHLGLFRQDLLNAYRITVEYTRAQANDELMQSLQDLEQKDAARFERLHDEWDQNRDQAEALRSTLGFKKMLLAGMPNDV